MIVLTHADVSVILKLASLRELDYMPTAELNDEGQTEIVRWIEYIGKGDDQLSPYAWFSLAEEAAASDDPDDPIIIEMLPIYTLSGESETIELCRISHFDWSIDDVPVQLIQNTDELLDAGVPVRFLLMAEIAGDTFSKRMCELYPDLETHQLHLMVSAANAFLVQLCESEGIVLDDTLLLSTEDDTDFDSVDEGHYDSSAIEEGIDAARSSILSIDPELSASLPASPDMYDIQWLKISR